MSAEYDAAVEVREGMRGIEESLDMMWPKMLTTREAFAGMAMQAIVTSQNFSTVEGTGSLTPQRLAAKAVIMADALIAELSKAKPE